MGRSRHGERKERDTRDSAIGLLPRSVLSAGWPFSAHTVMDNVRNARPIRLFAPGSCGQSRWICGGVDRGEG